MKPLNYFDICLYCILVLNLVMVFIVPNILFWKTELFINMVAYNLLIFLVYGLFTYTLFKKVDMKTKDDNLRRFI